MVGGKEEERDNLNFPFGDVSAGKDGHATIMASENDGRPRIGGHEYQRARERCYCGQLEL